MNFFEAIRMADEGKVVVSCRRYKYRKRNNSLYLLATTHTPSGLKVSYLTTATIDNDEVNGEWALDEEPEEGKGLWKHKLGDGSDLMEFYYERCISHYEQQQVWADALETFMNLKGHPLAVKAKDDFQQFCLLFTEDCMNAIKIDVWHYNKSKFAFISPMFATEEDARQAIKDIGEETLLKMAKVFQGIYE
jgi:hypothetical protein